MAKTIEQLERRDKEMEDQILSMKKAMNRLSLRLQHAERQLGRVAEDARRSRDRVALLERKLRGVV